MNIIIVGGGKVGTTLTESLCNEKHNVVLIDNNPKVIESIINTYDVMGICGNGASCDILSEASIDKAYLIIATTASDELNILCCLIARKMGARHCIARVRNPSYAQQLVFMRDELGLSMMVNPEYAAANEVSRMIRFPTAIKIEIFAKGRVELVEINVKENSPLAGLPLYKLYQLYKIKILICAVQRRDEVFIPDGNFILHAGDKIHITAGHSELAAFFKATGILKNRIRSVLIIGGGTLAYYLTLQLVEIGIHVKIIEQDYQRCQHLSETLPKATIIHADGTDPNVLNEEGIDDVDCCVTLTGIDEENILIAMYANSKSVNKVISKVNRVSLLGILDSLGEESTVSPKAITANSILRYIRAKQNTKGNSIKTLYRLVEGKVEALEFVISPNNRSIGIPLKELSIRKNLLIACIIRGNKVIIPNGNEKIKPNDSVIVVTTNQMLQDFDDILK